MRKATGPGKVRDNRNLPPAQREGITALLYNFDIDDASLKKEHRDWLEQVAAPIASCQAAQIFLKGSASRTGANDYNLQLSDRRVHEVRNFLLNQHARPDQFHLTWVGEEEAALTERDGTENELDRAVAVTVRLPNRRGVMKFLRLNPFDREDGFDGERMPQWVMVSALGLRRDLVLVHGQGFRLFTDKPSIAQLVSPVTGRPVNELTVTQDRQVVTIQGNGVGNATIFALDLATGAVLPLLEVSSLFPQIVTLATWIVTDPDHPTIDGPRRRSVASINAMLEEAKKVWLRQANIILAPTPPQQLNFTTRLSDTSAPLRNGIAPITGRTVGGESFPTLTARGDGTKRINVFYVWEWEPDSPDTDAEVDDIPGKNIIYEDDTGSTNPRDEGLSLGHEIGHCLGLEHTGTTDPALQNRLMWNFTNQRGGVLVREEVLLAVRNV
jgi:hypothetical protein